MSSYNHPSRGSPPEIEGQKLVVVVVIVFTLAKI